MLVLDLGLLTYKDTYVQLHEIVHSTKNDGDENAIKHLVACAVYLNQLFKVNRQLLYNLLLYESFFAGYKV